jgi:hypothetical protein
MPRRTSATGAKAPPTGRLPVGQSAAGGAKATAMVGELEIINLSGTLSPCASLKGLPAEQTTSAGRGADRLGTGGR